MVVAKDAMNLIVKQVLLEALINVKNMVVEKDAMSPIVNQVPKEVLINV